MSETSSRVRLMANLQAAVAEAVSGTMEERGRGFASDREAWAELKECIERTKQMHTDIEKPEIPLAAERQKLTYIAPAPALPETAAEETTEEPEEPTVEPEPENRYAELHFSDEDVYILACLVYHEARGESFEGQVAVVEVVLNRMLSDYFPDTVEEVVFQKYGDVWQFSPAPYLYSAEPDKEQYLAVHTAIEEREHILSEDTVYFSTAPYNESVDMIIGNHYFCKIF